MFNLSLLGVSGEIDILLKLIFKLKNSQFNYAPLIWIICRKTLYHEIEKIHHKTLKVIYKSEETFIRKVVQFLYIKDIALFSNKNLQNYDANKP